MGAVAVDSKGVVWAGTGEPDHGGGSAYYGKGVYRSADGGATWTSMGLEDGDTIGQIVIDPRDDDRVVVAVMGALHDTEPTRGLFLSEDGGSSWDRVIVPDSASTGAIDVSVNLQDPDVMLATTWDKMRDEKSRIYGPHSYVYRSTDAGRTWTNVHTAPLPQSETDPAKQTPDEPRRTHGRRLQRQRPEPRVPHLQHGARATSTASSPAPTPAPRGRPVGPTSGGTLQSISGGFAWWFGRVYVDPVDPLHVFVAGVSLAESKNGGLTWTTSQTPHADQHGVEWDPFTPSKVMLGNDGGFYWSTQNGAARGLWQKTADLPVTQFYEMDVSAQDPTRLNAGVAGQRLAEVVGARQRPINGDWFGFVGGDGMMNRIDPTNDRKYYGCFQNGGCRGFVRVGHRPGQLRHDDPGRRARTGSHRSSSPPTRRRCSAPASTSAGSTRPPASARGRRSAPT